MRGSIDRASSDGRSWSWRTTCITPTELLAALAAAPARPRRADDGGARSIARDPTPTRASPNGCDALSGAADRCAPDRARSLARRGVARARHSPGSRSCARRRRSCRTCSSARCRSFRPIAGGSRSTSRRRCAASSPIAPPTVRFLSNKRGYAATFGRDLLEAGFDPRDVMDKSAMLGRPSCRRSRAFLDRAVPARSCARATATGGRRRLAGRPRRRRTCASSRPDSTSCSGRPAASSSAAGSSRSPDARRARARGGHEAETLARAHRRSAATAGRRSPVVDVGERVGPPDAERAELTNLAARHVHTLRSRLDRSRARS